MTDSKTPRRPPQPPIPAERIVPGSRWQKNRACHQGQPPQFDVVDSVETWPVDPPLVMVHYHNEATSRRGKMLLKDFCAGSEHREPDPVEEAPLSGERPATEFDFVTEVRAIRAAQEEILAILKKPGQLSLAVPR